MQLAMSLTDSTSRSSAAENSIAPMSCEDGTMLARMLSAERLNILPPSLSKVLSVLIKVCTLNESREVWSKQSCRACTFVGREKHINWFDTGHK